MTITFPDEADEAIRTLVRLHPGKSVETVIIRAMTFYHAAYDLHLRGQTGEEINEIIEYLDKQDEKEGR